MCLPSTVRVCCCRDCFLSSDDTFAADRAALMLDRDFYYSERGSCSNGAFYPVHPSPSPYPSPYPSMSPSPAPHHYDANPPARRGYWYWQWGWPWGSG